MTSLEKAAKLQDALKVFEIGIRSFCGREPYLRPTQEIIRKRVGCLSEAFVCGALPLTFLY